MNTIEQNKKLVEAFPFLLPRNRWTDEVIEDYDYTWTELDAMPEGWRKLFSEHMCAEIAAILKKANYLDKQCYEILSERTCIVCGAPATRVTTGWISPYCDNCVSKDKNSVPIKEWLEKR